ncbi:MAG: hypothetical protein QOG96_24 [Pseudonocardiales bacterium]|jgi:hypothetical protein|nr:hypothetical protein [Pseudonocardiales bacterium]
MAVHGVWSTLDGLLVAFIIAITVVQLIRLRRNR